MMGIWTMEASDQDFEATKTEAAAKKMDVAAWKKKAAAKK
jgi:hypothetical protein